jgi:hypothetical protein
MFYRAARPESGREVRERLLAGGSLEFRASGAVGCVGGRFCFGQKIVNTG